MSQVGRNLSWHFSLHKLCVASCLPFTICCHQTPISFLPSLVGSSFACSQSACTTSMVPNAGETIKKTDGGEDWRVRQRKSILFALGLHSSFHLLHLVILFWRTICQRGRKKSGLSIAELKVAEIFVWCTESSPRSNNRYFTFIQVCVFQFYNPAFLFSE